MKITRLGPVFSDHRGDITDILQHIPVDSVTVITSAAGSIRGNHYHKESLQYLYLMSGRVRSYAQAPGQAIEAAELAPGDLLTTPPLERHAIEALEDSVFIVITRGPRGGAAYESDTFRVEPLQAAPDTSGPPG